VSNSGRIPGGILLLTVLVSGGVLGLLASGNRTLGQEYLKQSFVAASETRPIQLNADAVSLWQDGDSQVVLLKGNAWIGQGLTTIQAPAAVVFIDLARYKKTGINYLELYADNSVDISDGPRRKMATKAIVMLATQGEVRIKSFQNKVSKTPLRNDTVYRMGARELAIANGRNPDEEPQATTPTATPTPAAFPLAAQADAAQNNPLHELPPDSITETMRGRLRTDPALRPVNYNSAAATPPPPLWPGTAASPPTLANDLPPSSAADAEFELPPVAPKSDSKVTTSQYGVSTLPPLPDEPIPGASKAPPGPVEYQPPTTLPRTVITKQPGGPAMLPPADDQLPPATTYPTGQLPSPGSSKAPPGPVEIQPAPPGPTAPRTITTQQPGVGSIPPPPPTQPRGDMLGGIGSTGNVPRRVSIRPRSGQEIQIRNFPQADGTTAVVITNGIILTIVDPAKQEEIIDIESDRLVFWTSGDSRQLLDGMRNSSADTNRTLEFFMSGNVEVRGRLEGETQTLRADEVYYDVQRSVAVATQADLEIRQARLPNALHLKADEVIQYNPKLFKASRTKIFSSKLPSDPGLILAVREAEVEERPYQPPRRLFQFPWTTDTSEAKTTQKIMRGRGVTVYLRKVPVFYWPYVQGDPEDPMGPLEKISVNYNNIFGAQLFTTWNAYDLLGIDPVPGTRWRLMVDGMSERGPALGTEYDYAGQDLFGVPSRFTGFLNAYGIYDTGEDRLGGDRGEGFYVPPPPGVLVPYEHPDWRGRFLHRLNVQDMPQGFSVLTQVSLLSDPNFLEQFFLREYRNDPNQETYIYLKQQKEHFAWTLLAEQRVRDWVTETSWLPRADAHLIGQKFFNLFTYNMDASAGYANLGVTDRSPPVFFTFPTTDVPIQTGRFDFFNEVSMPLGLGPINIAPYIVGDATYYTEDLTGSDRLRLYGGGGIRANMPFSRLYPEAYSELLNVNSIFHKIMLSANYFIAASDTTFHQLPQLDRWNDDVSDQSIRDMYQRQYFYNPANAAFLTTSPLFDPQEYGLRRAILNRIDTRDDIDVLRLGARQRWQTKRGFPGAQHVVDWMVLDVQASIFPQANRDNFGEHIGVLEYDWVWHLGDRTSLVSSGWMETVQDGPRVFNIGANINRPDTTNFYLGYRQLDPLNSQVVLASMSMVLNPKYSVTASSAYDFGIDNQSNSLMISRIGTDLTVSFGFSYNSILDTFGINFSITPNLLPSLGPVAPGAGFGPPMARR